jgi:hypothetical protein
LRQNATLVDRLNGDNNQLNVTLDDLNKKLNDAVANQLVWKNRAEQAEAFKM